MTKHKIRLRIINSDDPTDRRYAYITKTKLNAIIRTLIEERVNFEVNPPDDK